jgi:cholestenol Delta-isomerase
MGISDVPMPPHPFYPPELNLVGYIANEWSMTKLLTVFFGSVGAYLSTTFLIVRSFNPKLNGRDLGTVVWFVLSRFT